LRPIKEVVIGVALLIIGGVVTFVVDRQLVNNENSTRYIDYETDMVSDIIFKSNNLTNVLLTPKGDTIRKLNRISFKVYNFSGRIQEQVPVYIELYYPNGKIINVLSYPFGGDDQFSDQITELEVSEPNHEGGFKKGFQINNMSSSYENGFEPYFNVDFYVQGEMPSYKLSIDKAGLNERIANNDIIFAQKWYETDWIIVLILVFPTILMFRYFDKKMDIKHDIKFEKTKAYIVEELYLDYHDYISLKSKSEFCKKITEDIFYHQDYYNWKTAANWRKNYLLKEPKKPNSDLQSNM